MNQKYKRKTAEISKNSLTTLRSTLLTLIRPLWITLCRSMSGSLRTKKNPYSNQVARQTKMTQMNSHSPHLHSLDIISEKDSNNRNKINFRKRKRKEKEKHCLSESGESNPSTSNGDTRRTNTKHQIWIQRMVFETRVVGIRAVD